MCSQTQVEIDGKKLKALLNDQNVIFAAASRKLGYCDNYISSSISRNTIRKSAASLLDVYYGIKLDSYIRKEPAVEQKAEEANSEKQQSVEIPEEFWTQLHHCIYSAVYEAVKKAWAE